MSACLSTKVPTEQEEGTLTNSHQRFLRGYGDLIKLPPELQLSIARMYDRPTLKAFICASSACRALGFELFFGALRFPGLMISRDISQNLEMLCSDERISHAMRANRDRIKSARFELYTWRREVGLSKYFARALTSMSNLRTLTLDLRGVSHRVASKLVAKIVESPKLRISCLKTLDSSIYTTRSLAPLVEHCESLEALLMTSSEYTVDLDPKYCMATRHHPKLRKLYIDVAEEPYEFDIPTMNTRCLLGMARYFPELESLVLHSHRKDPDFSGHYLSWQQFDGIFDCFIYTLQQFKHLKRLAFTLPWRRVSVAIAEAIKIEDSEVQVTNTASASNDEANHEVRISSRGERNNAQYMKLIHRLGMALPKVETIYIIHESILWYPPIMIEGTRSEAGQSMETRRIAVDEWPHRFNEFPLDLRDRFPYRSFNRRT